MRGPGDEPAKTRRIRSRRYLRAVPRSAVLASDPRYAALWTRSPGRSPFSHPAAVAAYAQAFGLGARVLAVEDEGEWAAAVPVFEKRRGPFVASALPPVCPVHRPLLAAPLAEAATHAGTSPLDRLLARLGAEADQATLKLGDDDLRPYAWAGWTVTPRATYHVALDHDVEARFSSAVRRMVRRESAAFEVASDPAGAADAVRLMNAAYERHDEPLGLGDDVLVGLAEAFQTAGLAQTVVARRGGAVEAAAVIASDGRTASYWIAGSVPGPAMTVLLGRTLVRLAGEGLETFDFCGANTPSIAEFKRRFGSVLAPAPLARHVSHPALRLADRLR